MCHILSHCWAPVLAWPVSLRAHGGTTMQPEQPAKLPLLAASAELAVSSWRMITSKTG